MNKSKLDLKKLIVGAFLALATFCMSMGSAYAQDASVPAFMNIKADLLDFTITDAVSMSGAQGETSLSVTPLVVTNNSDEQYIKVSAIKYVNTLSDFVLVSDESDFDSAANSYSLVMNRTHDFSNGDYIKDKPILTNGGSQTFKFAGHIGVGAAPKVNEECGSFIVTIEKTTEPYYNGFPVTSLSSVTWTDGNHNSIQAVLDAAYDGAIDPCKFCGWQIGDERRVWIGEFKTKYNPAGNNYNGKTYDQQVITLVLMNQGGEILTTGEECQFVVGFKESPCIDIWDIPSKTRSYVIGDAYNKYNGSQADQLCETMYQALIGEMRKLFKPWVVYVSEPTEIIGITDDGKNWITEAQGIERLERNFALPSINNVYSLAEQVDKGANQRTPEDQYVQTRYTYYESSASRIKKRTDTNENFAWYLRTPCSGIKQYDIFTIRSVTISDTISGTTQMNDPRGFSPVGCI